MSLQYFIKKYNHQVPKSNYGHQTNQKINSSSWYDIVFNDNSQKSTLKSTSFNISLTKADNYYSIRKVYLTPNDNQKEILLEMMEGYRKMYNEAHKKIKINKEYDFYKLRSSLKLKKDEFRKKYKTPTHCLDDAIKLIYSNYQSAFTNHKNGHIDKFKIRYWKQTKKNLLMGIEKTYFKENHIFKTIIKDELKNRENYKYNQIKADSKLIYYKNQDQFVLLVPIKKVAEKVAKKNDFIGIDLGLRTFMTGIAKNRNYEIAVDCSKKIMNSLDKINKINEKKLKKEKKLRKIEKIENKISNRVDDLHWKSINFLTSNFSQIVIGKLSTCGICKKDGNLKKKQKRVAYKLKFYKFLERLEHKCKIKGIKLKIVNESYTSKTCSNCGFINNVGGSKIYKCKNCKYLDDRDLNACRNMIYKALS